jgi:MFS family permease
VNGTSLMYLSWLILLVANMQTGFGAFISVHLTASGWDTGQIGVVLGAGTIAAIAAQVPAGMLVDGSSFKRNVAATAIAALMLALLVLAVAPGFVPVLGAEVVAGAAGPLLGLAIAALTLGLTRQEDLGERFGQNARFAAIGAAIGAGSLGLVGTSISDAAVFLVAALAGVGALWSLFRIKRGDLLLAPRRTGHQTAPIPAHRRAPAVSRWQLLCDRRLLALLTCVAAFHLTNGALLPLAAAEAARRAGDLADVITGAATLVPQVLVAVLSPWVGRLASQRGRCLVLLLGFAALPARALFFAFDGAPELLVVGQLLDGVSAAVFGVMLPLVVADITHEAGHFNFALGIAGMAVGLGAAASNVVAGSVADMIGLPDTFLILAALGVGATALVRLVMPETAHLPAAIPPPHVAHTAPLTPDPA